MASPVRRKPMIYLKDDLASKETTVRTLHAAGINLGMSLARAITTVSQPHIKGIRCNASLPEVVYLTNAREIDARIKGPYFTLVNGPRHMLDYLISRKMIRPKKLPAPPAHLPEEIAP